ncbi:hypothetical protein EHV23_02125 [Lautropia dentalis]|uniref:Uncharacterized protein n=1 Tax=Lautropia dentalis TaxID=2490857 RepID=A0A426FQY8_9BURK|nr:hypothetical protein [Lautropia dentalis]RRN45074.1 hypothetical protein EHV23_02125 [Lautropia dentalis]
MVISFVSMMFESSVLAPHRPLGSLRACWARTGKAPEGTAGGDAPILERVVGLPVADMDFSVTRMGKLPLPEWTRPLPERTCPLQDRPPDA